MTIQLFKNEFKTVRLTKRRCKGIEAILETVKTDKRLTRSSVFCRFFSLYLSFAYFLVVFTLFIVVFKSLIACLFIIL